MTDDALMEVVHYADPLCWWSWGLEPVLQRLREVYGDQVKITYKMGGFAESIAEWRKEYDVVEDKALRHWIAESISLTKNPIDIDYILKTRLESSWPACIAVKAAQIQDEVLAEKYFRSLMEAGQV